MINQFGSFSLYLSLFCSSYLIYKSFVSQTTINKRLGENVFSVLSVQLVLTLISFFSLIYAFVISDFSNITVYNNSHTLKPIFYNHKKNKFKIQTFNNFFSTNNNFWFFGVYYFYIKSFFKYFSST